MLNKNQFYSKKPLDIVDNIKIFCDKDAYIKNYEQISLDHLASLKDGISNTFIEEEIWKEMENSTYKILLEYTNKGCNILDIGVGTGRLLERMNNVNKFGVDIAIENLKLSCSKNIEVCLAKAENLPYKDKSFDIIVSTDVLEHTVDLNRVLSEAYRVLRTNGKFIIRVPYKEDLSLYASSEYPYNYSHLRNFDEYSLQLLFEKVFNLKLLKKSFVLYLPKASKLKCQQSKILNKLMWRFLYYVKKINKKVYNFIAPSFLYPVEINMVFEK